MKEEIIARFKTKFPAVNLSKKRLDELAAKLEVKITDENEIDAKLDELNELIPFDEIAKTDDKVADLKNKLKAAGTSTKKEDDADAPVKKPEDEMPAWAKPLFEELSSLKKEKALTAMQQKVATHEKMKGIPAVFYKGRNLPDKDEDLDTWVTDVETDWKALQQEHANNSFNNSPVPFASAGGNNSSVLAAATKRFIAAKTAPQEGGAGIVGKKL